MKNLRKINIGVLLTIIVLAIVVIYSINLENSRKKDAEEISQVIKEYINILNQNNDLSINEETLKSDMTKEEYENHLKSFKEKLKPVFSDNEKILNYKFSTLTSDLNEIYSQSKYNIISFENTFLKMQSSFFFENNSTVTINTTQKFKFVNDEGKIKEDELKVSNPASFSFELVKENGKWKITNTDLSVFDIRSISTSDSPFSDFFKIGY